MKQSLSIESERQNNNRSDITVSNASPVSQAFVDNRESTAVQRQLIAKMTNSPQAIAQRKLSEQIHNSSRMTAQRQQMAKASGGAVQRVEGEEELMQGKFKPIQRVEDEELLQGKFVTQRVEEEEELMQGKFDVTQRVEEEELMQGKFAPVQRVEEEELMQGKFDTAQRVEEEELMQGKFDTVQRVEEEELMQGKFNTAQLEQAPADKANNTGLPDNLKQGVENLSGMSMDNVKVHYNSSKPAQLNALAYAQGTDIHVGADQEKHLPHEAWHIVQQAQGRVKPTMQMKDGVPVNDDQALEQEADLMGAKAISSGMVQAKQESGDSIESDPIGSKNGSAQPMQRSANPSGGSVQRVLKIGDTNGKTVTLEDISGRLGHDTEELLKLLIKEDSETYVKGSGEPGNVTNEAIKQLILQRWGVDVSGRGSDTWSLLLDLSSYEQRSKAVKQGTVITPIGSGELAIVTLPLGKLPQMTNSLINTVLSKPIDGRTSPFVMNVPTGLGHRKVEIDHIMDQPPLKPIVILSNHVITLTPDNSVRSSNAFVLAFLKPWVKSKFSVYEPMQMDPMHMGTHDGQFALGANTHCHLIAPSGDFAGKDQEIAEKVLYLEELFQGGNLKQAIAQFLAANKLSKNDKKLRLEFKNKFKSDRKMYGKPGKKAFKELKEKLAWTPVDHSK